MHYRRSGIPSMPNQLLHTYLHTYTQVMNLHNTVWASCLGWCWILYFFIPSILKACRHCKPSAQFSLMWERKKTKSFDVTIGHTQTIYALLSCLELVLGRTLSLHLSAIFTCNNYYCCEVIQYWGLQDVIILYPTYSKFSVLHRLNCWSPINLVSPIKSSFASLLVICHSVRIALPLNAGVLLLVILLWCCTYHCGVHRSYCIGPLWCLGPPMGWHQEALSHGKRCEVRTYEFLTGSLFFLHMFLVVVRWL